VTCRSRHSGKGYVEVRSTAMVRTHQRCEAPQDLVRQCEGIIAWNTSVGGRATCLSDWEWVSRFPFHKATRMYSPRYRVHPLPNASVTLNGACIQLNILQNSRHGRKILHKLGCEVRIRQSRSLSNLDDIPAVALAPGFPVIPCQYTLSRWRSWSTIVEC